MTNYLKHPDIIHNVEILSDIPIVVVDPQVVTELKLITEELKKIDVSMTYNTQLMSSASGIFPRISYMKIKKSFKDFIFDDNSKD